MITVIVLKALCYNQFIGLDLKKVGMQPIDELYQFISNRKILLGSFYTG